MMKRFFKKLPQNKWQCNRRCGTCVQWNITWLLKKNEIMLFAAIWRDLEIAILNEISQIKKDRYYMKSDRKRQISLPIGGIFLNGTNELIYRTGDLPGSEIEPTSLTSPTLAGRFYTTNATWEAAVYLWKAAVRRSPVLLD